MPTKEEIAKELCMEAKISGWACIHDICPYYCRCTKIDIQCGKEECIGRWGTISYLPALIKKAFKKKLLGEE